MPRLPRQLSGLAWFRPGTRQKTRHCFGKTGSRRTLSNTTKIKKNLQLVRKKSLHRRKNLPTVRKKSLHCFQCCYLFFKPIQEKIFKKTSLNQGWKKICSKTRPFLPVFASAGSLFLPWHAYSFLDRLPVFASACLFLPRRAACFLPRHASASWGRGTHQAKTRHVAEPWYLSNLSY